MHSLILASGLVTLMFVFNSCIMIPGTYETVSREVIGARADATGKVYEQIVHYDKRWEILIIGILGAGPTYIPYSRYAARTEEAEYAIGAMTHFPSLAWTHIRTAIPIPNSDRWITFENNRHNTENENDIYVIVFSVRKGKIVRHRFKHVLRSPPREVKTLTGLYIEGDANLDWLRVHETDRITRVNTATGEIVPETEASPPFSPVELDWKALQKLEEQPLLRPKKSRPKRHSLR